MQKKSQKAQANIITVVLIILLVLVAVIIVWNVVRGIVKKSSEQVDTEALIIQLEIKNVQIGAGGGLEVEVHRAVGKGNITELKFILEEENGQTYIETISENLPDELETKTYSVFNLLGDIVEVKKISVVPVVGDRFGIEITKDVDVTIFTIAGLVSWWKFEEGFNDSIGKNHGINYSDAHTENNVLVLDGVDDYVDLGTQVNNYLSVNNNFTISAWFNMRSFTIYQTILGSAINANDRTYMQYKDGSIRVAIYNGSFTAKSVSSYSINKWHHVAMIKNGSDVTAYLDGSEMTGTNTPSSTGNAGTRIGIYTNNINGPFNGSIDDVMMFNKTLTKNQINAIYNNQKK